MRTTNSYTQPAAYRQIQGAPLRRLAPILTPPAASLNPPPALPSPPRTSPILPNFTLSTHLIPAAYPRSTAPLPLPTAPAAESKAARKARTQRQAMQLLADFDRHYHASHPAAAQAPEPLWNAVSRFVRAGAGAAGTGLTLYVAHANGFPKETYEPMLQELVARMEASSSSVPGYRIDEIWLLEAVNQGDSALVNAPRLHAIFDWKDHTRDHLNFFLHYLPPTPSPDPLPTLLARVPDAVADERRVYGLRQRTVFGVGHSLGGCTLTLAAHDRPNLFAGLVLVDALITPVRHEVLDVKFSYTLNALARRETWASREEAHKLLRASLFFGAWDPQVLQLYVEHGLAPDGKGGVKLKTTGVQEAATFSDTMTRQEAWTAVAQLDERIPLKWVCVGDPAKGVLVDEETERLRVWLRPANASNVRVPGASHLIPQERPRELGKEIHAFLVEEFGVAKALL